MLMVLCYNHSEDGFVDSVPLCQCTDDIGFDAARELWWTHRNPERKFRLGQDVRVPEHPENPHYFGPAFVYDDANAEQQSIVDLMIEDSSVGIMPKP